MTLLYKRVSKLESFSKEMKLDKGLFGVLKKAITYAAHKIIYQWLEPSEDIFYSLPDNLRFQFLKAISPEIVMKNSFFEKFEREFATQLVPLLKPLRFKCGEYIWEDGDYSGNVIFLTSGTVNFIIDNNLVIGEDAEKTTVRQRKLDKKIKKKENVKNYSKFFNTKKQNILIFKRMKGGSYFGETDILLKRRRTCSLVAQTDCEAFTLSRKVKK